MGFKGGLIMIKVFISQLMNGLTDEEIIKERTEIVDKIVKKYPFEDILILDNFFNEKEYRTTDDVKNKGVWCLGKSINVLSEADLAVFSKDYTLGRGTVFEYNICKEYDIETLIVGETL